MIGGGDEARGRAGDGIDRCILIDHLPALGQRQRLAERSPEPAVGHVAALGEVRREVVVLHHRVDEVPRRIEHVEIAIAAQFELAAKGRLHLVMRGVVIGAALVVDVEQLSLPRRMRVVGNECLAQHHHRVAGRGGFGKALPRNGEIARCVHRAVGSRAVHEIGFDGLEIGGELVGMARGHRLHLPRAHVGDDARTDHIASEPNADAHQQRRPHHCQWQFLGNLEFRKPTHAKSPK
jgi:hypothetical protein